MAEGFRALFSNSSRESLKDPGLNPAWGIIQTNLCYNTVTCKVTLWPGILSPNYRGSVMAAIPKKQWSRGAESLPGLAKNHWKRFEMNKKGWKRLKNSVLTSFWVRAALKSWSKYTTNIKGLWLHLAFRTSLKMAKLETGNLESYKIKCKKLTMPL